MAGHRLKDELYELMRSDPHVFDFLQAGSLDGIWYWDVERREEEWMSPRFKELFGYEDDEIPNTAAWWQENIHVDDLPVALENFERHLADPEHPYDQVVRYRHKNGSIVWVRCRGIAIRDDEGNPTRLLGAHTDLTELMEATARLAMLNRVLSESQEKFRKLFEEAPIGMCLVDLDGTFLSANAVYGEIVGRPAEELVGMTFQEITHPHDLDTDVGLVNQLLQGSIDRYEMEKRYLRPEGDAVWVQLNVSLVKDESGEPLHFIAQVQDIDERKQMERELVNMAIRDDLTGLLNRRAFAEELTAHERHARRYGTMGALLVVDLDGFKAVNDQRGHLAGDAALRATAEWLTARLRESDVIGRLGGDEFAVLLPQAGDAERMQVSSQIEEGLAEALAEHGPDGSSGLSASVGAAPFGPGDGDADHVLAAADAAMYSRKAARAGAT